MLPALLSYSAVGLVLFFIHQLLLFPQVFLRPLAPLLFYVGLRASLPVSLTVAVVLGLLQDSYALAPLGVQVMGALIPVVTARLARRRFLFKSAGPVVLGMLAALGLQELGLRLTLMLLGFPIHLGEELSWRCGLELVVTAVLTPVFFGLFRFWDNLPRHLGRSRRQVPASW